MYYAKKIMPIKSLVVLTAVILTTLIFFDSIHHYLTFDVNAPDLGENGVAMKLEFFRSMLSLDSLLFRFNLWQSILFPVLFVISISQYTFLKTRFLKYYIGHKDSMIYNRELVKLKFFFVRNNLIVFFAIFLFIAIISYTIGSFELTYIDIHFEKLSLLYNLINNKTYYLVYYIVMKSLGITTLTLLALYLSDYFNSFIQSSIALLIILWLITPILHKFIPFYLVPLVALMVTSFNQITLWQALMPNLVIIAIITYIHLTNKYEVV